MRKLYAILIILTTNLPLFAQDPCASSTQGDPAGGLTGYDTHSSLVFNATVGNPSASQYITLYGCGVNAPIVSVSSNFKISLTNSNFTDTIITNVPNVGDAIDSIKVYIIYDPQVSAVHQDSILFEVMDGVDGSPIIKKIPIRGTSSSVSPTPLITTNGNLGIFNTVVGTPSSVQTLTISGTDLTNDVSVAVSEDFEITTSGAYTTSLTIPMSAGLVNSVVSIRYKPNTVKTSNGVVSIQSTGATAVDVAIQGSSVPSFSATATLNLNTFASAINQVSVVEGTINVSGINLSNSVWIKAPTNFKVSLTSGTSYADSVSVIPTNAGIVNRSVFVVFKPTSTGTFNDSVQIYTAGVSSKKKFFVSGTTVAANIMAESTNTQWNVFPNPSAGIITIKATDINKCIVTDVYGRILIAEDFKEKNELTLDLSHFSKGVYFVKSANVFGHKMVQKLLLE